MCHQGTRGAGRAKILNLFFPATWLCISFQSVSDETDKPGALGLSSGLGLWPPGQSGRAGQCLTWPDPACPRGGSTDGGLSDPQGTITPLEKARLLSLLFFEMCSFSLNLFHLKGIMTCPKYGNTSILGVGCHWAARDSLRELQDALGDALWVWAEGANTLSVL